MPKKYKHITLDDRTLIQTQLQQGFKPAEIAASLGRPRSCVTRELARNGWEAPSAVRSVGRPAIAGGYFSSRANLRARRLSVMPRVECKLVVGNPLWRKVNHGLQQGLSPHVKPRVRSIFVAFTYFKNRMRGDRSSFVAKFAAALSAPPLPHSLPAIVP